MKNLQIIALLAFLTLILPILAMSQDLSATSAEKDESPYKNVNLKFVLEGSPTPEDVGFNTPKSYWKFTYELRFMDKDVNYKLQEKVYAKYKNRDDKLKWISKANKKIGKARKKVSILVAKGKFTVENLSAAKNREIIIPVELSEQIQEILAKAGSSTENPTFVITARGRVSTKPASNRKFKKKYQMTFLCPSKTTHLDKSYWMSNTFGISVEISKKEDGRIVFSLFSRI